MPLEEAVEGFLAALEERGMAPATETVPVGDRRGGTIQRRDLEHQRIPLSITATNSAANRQTTMRSGHM